MKKYLFLLLFTLFHTSSASAQIITTVVGGGTGLGDGGPAMACELFNPAALAFDAAGNYYISDRGQNRIRKVDVAGIVTTIAGTGTAGYNGDNISATAAQLARPYGIAIDSVGNIYFCDNGNYRIRKINKAGIITTIAGNGVSGYNGDGIPALTATIYDPGGLALDPIGNIYIADYQNNRIRKINTVGIISTIAGTGVPGYNGDGIPATTAELFNPEGIVADGNNNIFFSDYQNNRIRKINALGIITTIAGTGVGGYSGDGNLASNAQLNRPIGITIDANNNLFIADVYNNVIRKISTAGVITTVAGNGHTGFSGDGGMADSARLFYPTGVTLDAHSNLYICDLTNNRVRFVASTVSIKELEGIESDIIIYPNPSIGLFHTTIKSAIDFMLVLTVTNMFGEKIKEITAESNQPIDLSLDAPAGFYFLIATLPSGVITKNIFIVK